MNILNAIEDFINYCVFEKGLSDKTKLSYENDLKLYSEFLRENNIKDVNNSEVVTLQTSNKTTNLIWNRDFDNLYTEADYLTILSKLTTNQTLMMAFYNGKYDQKDPASVAKTCLTNAVSIASL